MKAIYLMVLVLFSSVVQADQRFETVGGFCHFVLNPENDDNEVFFANCQNSIVQNNDGTGRGSTIIEVKYPFGSAPIEKTLILTGEETGIPCVMVDSNGTTYSTLDWTSKYQYRPPRGKNRSTVIYEMICSNGQQQ